MILRFIHFLKTTIIIIFMISSLDYEILLINRKILCSPRLSRWKSKLL
jgi:hypothetical protein